MKSEDMLDKSLEPTSALVAPEKVMGFTLWPDSPNWSFQFLKLIEESYFGGADFTECYLAARDIKAGDVEAWHTAFHTLAADLERKADQAMADGHPVSARLK